MCVVALTVLINSFNMFKLVLTCLISFEQVGSFLVYWTYLTWFRLFDVFNLRASPMFRLFEFAVFYSFDVFSYLRLHLWYSSASNLVRWCVVFHVF